MCSFQLLQIHELFNFKQVFVSFSFFLLLFFLVDKQNYDIHNAYWEKKIFLLKETSGFFSGIQE